MPKSENTQKSDKTPKVVGQIFFARPHGLPGYFVDYTDDGTIVHNEFTLPYRNNNVKIIGHDAVYFDKYFAGFGFE
ncbi:MAG TPA: hypothetical protein LFW21_05480 [Rickettsia endosymbiont of Pyrocoelia pectoralis]|nr:hypothetical protein [Rickettsia endosymbiont of Pyrocoelia pectoralis]